VPVWLAQPRRQGHGRYGKPVGCGWRGAPDKSPSLTAPEEEHGHQPERDLSEPSVVARRGPSSDKVDGESAVLAKIAEM